MVIVGKAKTKKYEIIEVGIKDKKNRAEMHEKADDIYFVLGGSARLTLGGRIVKKIRKSAGEYRGDRIAGGKTRLLKKGEIISIPRRTPHMMDARKRKIGYVVVKVH
ncbi:hypothetical protein COV19_05815 [Candidatus Woesearchaeota archaeon CG10_big_fil_rev_8_21_14_0_10_44_13]|nr:MAG: hypothetical protein COV19_05815 [Candidatus Woesearchaeota archaeon CG10_big_fil_rev_8_21_14_0_10_44_13]